MSPTCQLLVHDPRRAGQPTGITAADRSGWADSWRQCGYQATGVWVDLTAGDTEDARRLVCARHHRELELLAAQGRAGRVRWVRRYWAPETVFALTTPVPSLPPVAADGSTQLALSLEVPSC